MVSPDALERLPLPCVAHWEANLLVVVEKVRRRSIDFVDPGVGRRRLPSEAFAEGFSGVALTFAPIDPRRPTRQRRGKSPSAWRIVLLPALRIRRRVAASLAATSALLMIAGLVVPFATAAVVNQFAQSPSTGITRAGWPRSPPRRCSGLGWER